MWWDQVTRSSQSFRCSVEPGLGTWESMSRGTLELRAVRRLLRVQERCGSLDGVWPWPPWDWSEDMRLRYHLRGQTGRIRGQEG